MLKKVLQAIGNFFIVVSFLLFSASSIMTSILYYRNYPDQKGIFLGLVVVSSFCYLIGLITIGYYLFRFKKEPKQEAKAETKEDSLYSYIPDIYATVHKNHDLINAIIKFLNSVDESEPDDEDQAGEEDQE